jgi:hypothetical protein
MLCDAVALPKLIPKPVFQIFALGALAMVWGGTAVLAWTHTPPVSYLVDALGPVLGCFSAWVLASIAWMFLVIPFRLVTAFATLDETLRARGARDVSELFAQERAKARNLGALPERERRQRYFLFAGVSLTLSLAFGVAFLINLEQFPEHVLAMPPILALITACMAPYYLVRALMAPSADA